MYVNRAPAVHKSRFANGHAGLESRGGGRFLRCISGRTVDSSTLLRLWLRRTNPCSDLTLRYNGLAHCTTRTLEFDSSSRHSVMRFQLCRSANCAQVLSGKFHFDGKSTFYYRKTILRRRWRTFLYFTDVDFTSLFLILVCSSSTTEILLRRSFVRLFA